MCLRPIVYLICMPTCMYVCMHTHVCVEVSRPKEVKTLVHAKIVT